MSQFRVIRVSLALLLVCAFPLIASAATTDFRVLFDVDHDIATGCNVSGMPGVDQVFTTRVETTASTATVTQTFRQVCTGLSLGPQISIENLGWPAGFQSSSGQLLVETRIPFTSFPDTTTPRNMRIGLVGSQGAVVHTALTRPNGDLVFFPAPARGRRRSVAAPGGPRVITLDGIGTDWNGLKAMFDGIGASGTPGLRIEKFFGFADTNHNLLYFRFDANLSTSAPFAANDFYTRALGQGLTVPGVNGDPTVLENDTDPNGLPLTATLVSQPPGGQVVLDATGGFTYTPTNPNSEEDDSFEYRASNGTQDSNVATVTIAAQEVEVSGPNQEPSFNKGADPLVLEDSGPQSIANWATNVTAGPDEDDDQTVTFVVTNVINPDLFDDPPAISANGTLTFTPAANAFGIATVSVKLIDDGGTEDGGDSESPVQNFFITIDSVNDAPSFTPGPGVVVEDNDGAQNLPWATGMSPGPANESTQVLHFTLTNDNPSLFSVQPSIAPNGTLTFTPAPGQTGFANIMVFLHDDGGTANGGVDTSAGAPLILTVEKAPLITSANNTTFTVGTAGSFTVTTSGIPRPSIARTGTLPAGVTFVDGTGANKGTGFLTGTPAPGTGGTYPLTFQATNVRGSSPIQNFTLTVNQPPAITSGNTATFVRNQAGGSFTITTTGFPAPTLSLSGNALPAGLTFTNNGNGTATINGTPTAPGGSYPGIVVTASNGVGTNATQNLTVVINEAPAITSANSLNIAAGVPVNFTVTTTGFPTPSLSETGALPAGITFTNNGNGTATIAGTAAEGSGGVYPITINATNVVATTPQSFTITVCNTIAVTNPATPSSPVGAAFSQTFTQTGAVGSATFTTASTLPAGLTLSTAGVLSGTPTQLGTFPITVTVTDANGCTGTGAVYNLTIVCQTITVTNPANANGVAGTAFSETFTQTGAIGGATFTLASGTLPAGLTLAANGVLSGTPTQTGVFPITVTVTDGNGCTGTSATYNLTIACQTITVTNPANANGTANAAFSETFTQTGAIGGATFTLATGTLPAGMTLATNGVLSGTPTQVGSFPISVTVTDGNGCTGTSASYNLTIACQTITVTNPANTNGTVNSPFSETFTQTGAIGTATFTTSSTLPAGLTLSTAGVLSGTPMQPGTYPIVVTVTDSNGCTGTSATYNLVIDCQTITVSVVNGPGTAGSPFSITFTQTGGIPPVTFTTSSTLPNGLTLATNGVLSGTPTQTGNFPIIVTATDANGCTGSTAVNIVIACPTITVTNPANSTGTAGSAFSETFTQSGAVGSATFTLASGTLPAGLTLAANGVLSGTPTQSGSFPVTVMVTDANGCTGTGSPYNLVIVCPTITVTNPANTAGTVGSAFSETFTQVGAVGSATFTTASTLPAGLTLSTAGVLSGTPTQFGTFPIDVTVTDANGCTGTGATYNLVISCQTITVTNPANTTGTAGSAFSETFTQTGALGGATFSTASTLPAGLTLSAAGVLSGTPTETGTFPIVVTVTDGNGCTGTGATYNLAINCQIITVNNPANANGTGGSPFSETFTQTGAIGGATFTLATGTLPAGLTLAANGVLSGTPTQTGSFPITVTVTDSNGCTGTGGTYNLTIACPTITVTNPANTNGTVSAAFSETFTQTGAVGTATFTSASTLPAGLTLSTAGVLSGTPTQTGSFPIVVTVTDSNGCTGTGGTYTLVIGCQTITVTNPANTNGTVNAPFSETFTQTSAVGGATFTTASTLPAGITLAANGVLSGTPTQNGTFPIVVTVTDGNGCTGTSATYNLVIACQVITVTNPANDTGAAGSLFSETFTQTDAVGTAMFTLGSGTLPTGLTLSTAGVLSGTPTQGGTFPITVLVTDSNGCTGTSPTYNLTITCPVITVNNPVNTTGTANAAFSETFTQTGAVGTATFTTSSTLPAGLTLATNGVLSGTPTQTGCFPIVVTVTDSNGCTGVSSIYNLCIGCQTITVTSPGNSTGTANAAFSETFTQTGAIGTATFTTSDPLPTGLTLSTAGVLSGTPTQTGSFPITVTVTDSNGCTGTSALYTIVINCQTITVNSPANANGTILVAFSETFTQTGAIGTATFTTSDTLPNGLTLSTAGVLSGTPTVTGSFPITVTVTDSNGCTGTSALYTIVIACQTITVTNPANGNGTVNAAFSETFLQSGANGGATFTLNSGTLPTGLSLAGNGVLSGIPTQTGSFPITVLVTDGNSCTGVSATYTIVIGCQTITVNNPSNATGTVGSAFSETFTQVGAFGSATFTTSSTLPTGLSLSTGGVLSGMPTQSGSFPIVVTVTDANGCTGTSATYNLTINCQVITVTNPGITTGTVSTAFSQQFTQTGAIGTATFTTSSTLPNGLTLATDGTLSGIPLEDGSFPIVVTVTDTNGCTGTGATYTLVISCQTITVNNPANANGTAGQAFSETFTQTGAIGTATFTINSGTLPNGLTLAANGTLSGIPTQNGSFPITVLVTDSNGCTGVGATYTLVIACAPLTFNPTNTMPNATYGVAYSQNISISGGTGPYTLTLVNATNVPTSFTFTDNGNGTATVASANPTVTGVFTFDVKAVDTASNCEQTQTFSFTVAPNVQNDTYSAANGLTDSVGNTQAVAAGFSTPTTPYVNYAPSVLANDSAPPATLTVVTPSVTNAAGTITFNAAGGWSYIPALNFTGTASFNFVVASNGAQANATVNIVVTNKVWYVKNDFGNTGDGRSHLPFDTLVEAQSASAAGEIIYVMTGNGGTFNQDAGITLKATQQLIGAGVALVVNSNNLAGAGTNPQITNSTAASDAVTLHDGNTVSGLTITAATRDGIAGNGRAGFTGNALLIQNNVASGLHLTSMTGTVTVTSATITGNGTGLDVNNGTAAITLGATNSITANAGQRSVSIQNRPVGAGAITLGLPITDNGTGILVNNNAAGTIAFGGTLALTTTTNTAVNLTTNTGTTINFTGPLTINTTTGTGFNATGGGTLSVTGTTNVTTGAATNGVNINGVTSSGITFTSLNTTGATTGLSLTSLGNGNVTVNGGTLGAGTGVSLNTLGTSNVTLNNVTVTATTTGISGATFGTLTIAGTVNVSGPTALSLNTGTVSGTFNNVSSTGGTNGVTLTGVSGTWGATAGSLTGATAVTFNVSGGSGNITWGATISQANGNRVVSVAASNSAVINFNGNVTSSGTSTGVILTASSGTYNFNATNSFTGASGILISNGQSGTISFSNATTIGNVTNTPFQVDGSVAAVTAAITYGGTIAKTSGGALIDVNNLDTPGTLSMTHTPAAAGNLSINSPGSTGISVINSSSTNITIANASVTFQNAGPGFTSTTNTGGTINLQGIALAGSGNDQGMLLAGAGTINVTNGAAASSINMTGASVNAIDGTTTAFTGTLNINNTTITGGGATAVRLGGGTLSGTGSSIAAGAQTALNLSGVALTNGAGLTSITSTGGVSGVILANVTGGTYTIAGGSLTGNTTAAWVHTNSAANAATISFAGSITPANNARAVDIGAAGASTGLRGGTITLSGAITTTSSAANANAGGIRVRNSTGGTLTLSNATQSYSSNANIAVELATNPGTTFNFSGGTLTIASTTGKGFVGSGGGTINVTGANNTISSTGANAFEVVGSAGTHFGGGYEWRSITSTNGTKGISLQFHDGAFTVTGDGPDGGTAPDSVTSGGTITGSDQRGAEFIDVDGPVSLNGMTFTNPADGAGSPDATVVAGTCGNIGSGGSNTGCFAGIHLDTVGNVTLLTVNVSGSGQMGINGNAVSNLVINDVNVSNSGNAAGEDGVRFFNLSGNSGSITDLIVTNSFAKGMYLENSNVALASGGSPYLVTDSNFQGSPTSQGVLLSTIITGTMHVKFVNGTVSNNFSNGIQTGAVSTGTLGVYVDNTNFFDNTSAVVVQASGGTTAFDIRNIDHVGRTTNASCGICIKSDGSGIGSGTIISNLIGNGTVGSGASCGGGCNGINVDARITSQLAVEIRGNTIRNVDQNGIGIRGGEGSSKLNVTLTGNLIRDPDNTPGTLAAIFADSGVLSSDTNCVTVQFGGLTAYPGSPSATVGDIQNRIEGNWLTSGVRARKLFGGGAPPEPVFNIPGYDGSGVVNWIQNRNSFSGVTTPVTQNAGGGGAFTGAVACP